MKNQDIQLIECDVIANYDKNFDYYASISGCFDYCQEIEDDE